MDHTNTFRICKNKLPFYKETNVKKYLDLHDKYITRSYMRDEWWSSKYHYEYWSNGVLFYPHQNKDFPSGMVKNLRRPYSI